MSEESRDELRRHAQDCEYRARDFNGERLRHDGRSKQTGNTAAYQDQNKPKIEQASVEHCKRARDPAFRRAASRSSERPVHPEYRPADADDLPIRSRHKICVTPVVGRPTLSHPFGASGELTALSNLMRWIPLSRLRCEDGFVKPLRGEQRRSAKNQGMFTTPWLAS